MRPIARPRTTASARPAAGPHPGSLGRPARRRAHLLLAALLAAALPFAPVPGAVAHADAAPAQPATAQASAAQAAAAQAVVVPAIDRRGYRALTLDNGIRVMLVSDPESDKAAASLSVERGSFDEPADIPGLAHFLEHMLFLGTAKYPGADEYQTFINTHGGSHNAYTAGDHTNYFFDVAAGHFTGALDRFAQFFVAPTFDAAYVAREMNAVNSEYQLQVKDDGWRGNAVEKTALNPAHPMSRFTIGTLETLGDRPGKPTREALIRFYEAAYAPQDMALAVYGPESLDALEALVRSTFAAVPARPGLPRAAPPPVVAPGTMPRRIEFRPERRQHSLGFAFALPGIDAHYRENPLDYIANLLGHEGEGSLHALLKGRGWIESLAAGGGRVDAANAVLNVQMELTPEGVKHEADIGEALFAYLALLRAEGVQARQYDEQARLARLGFDYQETGRAISEVTELSVNLQRYPLADVLRGPFARDRFDAALIDGLLAHMTPANVLVTVANPDTTASERERWFGVDYASAPLDAAVRARWSQPVRDPALAMPAANPFVPEQLGLVAAASPAGRPVQLPAAPGLALWHLADADFRTPRAAVLLRLQSDLPAASPRDAAAIAVLAMLLNDELNTFAYPALLAGLSYDVRQDPRGLLLSVGGYSDRQALLLERVLSTMKSLRVDPVKFERFRAQLARDWENVRKARPYEQAIAEVGQGLVSGRYSPEALREAVLALDVAAVADTHARLLRGLRADLFVHGNHDAAGATRLGEIVSSTLPLCGSCAAQAPTVRAVRAQSAVERKVEHDDAALVLYVQGDSRSVGERARYGLLAHMLAGPYFDALRTTQQLGYVVGVSPAVLDRVPGVSFIVQSPVAGVPALIDATRTFLADWRKTLAAMPAETFEAQKQGLLVKLLEPDANLAGRTARLWSDLADDALTFDTRDRIAEAIQALDAPTFGAFVDAFIARADSARLVVGVPGKFGGTTGLGVPPAALTAGPVPR